MLDDKTARMPKAPEMLTLSAEDQRRWLRYFANTDPDYRQLLHYEASPTDIILYLLARKAESQDVLLRHYREARVGYSKGVENDE